MEIFFSILCDGFVEGSGFAFRYPGLNNDSIYSLTDGSWNDLVPSSTRGPIQENWSEEIVLLRSV